MDESNGRTIVHRYSEAYTLDRVEWKGIVDRAEQIGQTLPGKTAGENGRDDCGFPGVFCAIRTRIAQKASGEKRGAGITGNVTGPQTI
jgi:hypothetical protein